MQVRSTIRKVSAMLGSTLLIGSTLGAAATLADFPGMFVADDGTPTAQIVVGSQGKISDVVSAVNVAGALGQATMGLEQRTEQVTASVNGGVGWSATDGRTLDTRNDNLYFGDQIDDVRQTLTGDHLDVLRTTTFQDDAGNSQDVEQYLYVGSQATGFGNPGDTSDRDPFLYVDNPSSISAGSGTGYLYKLQANFGEGLTLDKSGTESDGNADGNDDVLGQEVELFGKTFTISEDSFDSNNPGQLVLYGSSQEYDLETGQSTTVTINGEEHTLEVRAVTDSNTTAFYVDDQLKEKDEGATFSVDGQDVRVKDIIQTASDTSSGLVTFAIGSQKYVFEDGQPVQDGDGDEIEGTKVQLSGTGLDAVLSGQTEITVSSLEVAVGAADSGTGFVEAGSMFQDPVFDSLSFRFGGLSPDASGDSSMVEEVSFQQSDDETASVTFTPRGQSQTSVG
ncbi:MAG: S-layer protein, partial [Candidatus Nanohaloarchaea archaeon]|nr:S-layer protein [Candidatus Nanohaloarchaea archaeon]